MIELCDYDLTGLFKSGRNAWFTDYMKEHEPRQMTIWDYL